MSLLSKVVKLLEEEAKKKPKTTLRTNYRKEDLQPKSSPSIFPTNFKATYIGGPILSGMMVGSSLLISSNLLYGFTSAQLTSTI